MGRTVRFDHIFVSNMDADPTEQDILTTVRSIITSEIEADEIVVDRIGIANTVPTKSFSIGADLFMQSGQEIILDVSKTVKTARMNVTDKIGVKTTNPLHDFQVGDNQEFFIGVGNRDLVTINGNVLASNLILTNQLELADKIKINNSDSNVLHVTGNTFTTNATVGSFLSVGNELDPATDSNVAVFENGNVVVKNGVLRIFGNTEMVGNLSITEIPDYLQVNSLVISNAVIQMATDPTNTGAFSGNDGTYDMATLMVQNAGDANVFFGYTQSDDTMKLGRTFGGPLTQNFTIDPATTTNLHIFGELYTQNNVGIANTSPDYSLSVGSNVYINDTATSSANVLHANGYGYFKGMRIGDDGLSVGSLITLDADAAIPMVVTSTIQAHSIQTTGNTPTGIANTNPTDTFSVGDEFFVNTAPTAANTLTVLGNTVTNRLITQSIRVQDFIEVEGDSGITSTANVLIHADTDDGDTLSNAVVIKAGPLNANISAIEVYGARTSTSAQNIRFFTKNTERMRVVSNGNIGIANTSPTDKLTVGGTVRVIGSNAFTMGTETNYMKAFSDVIGTQTKIESRVGTGKGLNFYASTTDTMGVPKMTILETSNVGIGVTNPQGRLHVSGGSAFMNTPISDGYNHLTTPLVVTNTTGITSITDARPVLDLSRNATGSKAVRATFKLGKYQFSGTTSKSKLDIYLSDANYADEVDVMTLQADGRVGIGSTQPSAFLEVIADGTGNPRTNGIMVHNIHGTGYGDAIMTSRTDNEIGNAFASHIQTNNGNFDSRRGWSTGVTGSTGDYRITSNVDAVSDVASTAIYINGLTRDVGIGTDAPRAKLEVNGNVVIGNQLTFGGVSSDEFGNTFITERLYDNLGKSELVIFKGNDRTGTAAPDRIRSIAAEHLFQTYNTTLPSLSTNQIQSALLGDGSVVSRAMTITPSGVVVIGALPLDDQGELDVSSATRFYVGGGLEFAQDQSMKFGALDIFTAAVGPVNLIESIGNAPLVFRQKVSGTSTEYARFTNEGLVGFGTNSPDTNVHIYSGVTTDLDMLKLESPGTNKKTGISLNTNDNYGGYVRGFSNTQHSIHGTVLGAVKNSVEVDGIHIIDSGNVGIGTVNPSEHFTVYGGTTRIEHPTSNAVLEFKTTSGISNIYGDVSGNVYIDPYSNEMIINSNLEITGDLSIDGKIDLGNQVAVDLGEATANTALHVGGGFISGSNEVACKRYSKTFSIATTEGQDVQITFQPQTFYAKIVAQLRETSDVDNVSTMILEVQGGTHDGTAPSVDIAIGTKNMFSGLNLYPWSPTVVTGKRSVQIAPNIADGKFYPSGVSTGQTGRNYTYDIFVEVVSGVGGGVKHFTHNIGNSPSVTLDNGGGGNTNLSGSGFEYTY
jgi:hypothetical protein